MTSQTWLDSSNSNRPVWTHQLVVVVPDNLTTSDTGFLYITGGGNNHPGTPSATSEDVLFAAISAVETGMMSETWLNLLAYSNFCRHHLCNLISDPESAYCVPS